MPENSSNDAARRVNEIMERAANAALSSGRSPDDITVMCVTKNRTVEQIAECVAAGVRVVGENRAQEFRDKRVFFEEHGCETHIIGHLQSNKIKYAAGIASSIDSVDSFETASLISERAAALSKTQNIMIEVNIGHDPDKWGVSPDAVEELIYRVSELDAVRVTGLMTILPITDERATEKLFIEMQKLYVDIKNKKIDNIDMNFLSMGMSHDYELAIKSGANLVRIGTAFFG